MCSAVHLKVLLRIVGTIDQSDRTAAEERLGNIFMAAVGVRIGASLLPAVIFSRRPLPLSGRKSAPDTPRVTEKGNASAT